MNDQRMKLLMSIESFRGVMVKFFWNVFKPFFSLFLIVCWGWYIQLLNVIVRSYKIGCTTQSLTWLKSD